MSWLPVPPKYSRLLELIIKLPNVILTLSLLVLNKVFVLVSLSLALVIDYRQTSLLSNIGKITQKRMQQRLNFFIGQYNCYYPFQFGRVFKLNYSTNNALMSIVANIQTLLDNGDFATGVFVELRKAFDTVDHRILIQKLEHYGVRGILKKYT